ncbi:MAG: fibronectin type III domain-containing protein [Bacteroidales bacterium]|nr:fibronectin type III domain-containing protein [Bacteroidales bacterium]
MRLPFKLLALCIAAGILSPGCGQPDNPDTPVALAAPEGLTVKGLTENSVTMQWNPVEGATSYEWKVLEGAGTAKSGNETKRNVTVEGLKPGTAYTFSVRSRNSECNSEFSSLDFTTPGSQQPDVPEGKVQCIDAPLVLGLDSAPTLGSSGCIKVFTRDGKEVDRIDLADLAGVTIREDGCMIPKEPLGKDSKFNSFMDAIQSGKRYRIEHYTPLRIKGNKLEIKLHNGALDFGKSYYVTVDQSVAGKAVGKDEWTFSTKSRPAGPVFSVLQDGSGDFCTVQGALTHASSLDKNAEVTVEIGKGVFNEMLFLYDKGNITIKGASAGGTVISYPNNESYCSGTGSSTSSLPSRGAQVVTPGGRGLFLINNSDNLRIESLTLENSFGGQKGQAEAIYFNSAGKMVIESCSLLSWQDTFLTKGKVWVHNTLIAGHVDYIWGYPEACLFEDCEIRSRAGGYIVQARIESASHKGFVFLNCKLTAESGVKDGSMYLARSGGDTTKSDNVTYIGCKMSPVIASAGWFANPAPTPAVPTATAGWREYGSTDLGGAPLSASRNSYGRQLTAAEAEPYSSRQSVLGW